MNDKNTALLNEYFKKIKNIRTRAELKELNRDFSVLFGGKDRTPGYEELTANVYSVVSELITLREERGKRERRASTELSEAEHSEIYQVQRLIDYNLFTYHFQPIVRADNGEIYSYEALMRAGDMQGITPFHILKYAEMTDRLAEVEQYTFLNVLHFLKDNRELFNGRPVFINSMPSVHIDPASSDEIGRLLELLTDLVVVEMTENSEYNDAELNDIKEKYRGLNIRIAIDDYGTGYSNISNLMRYTPNFVKIDRSLLSGIQNSPNKKHFVREIIDFCHENNILALAEGVENSEELRTVILLGADLIQGFYVARPAPVIISSVPYEIKAEIRSHRQEREDGKRLKIYTAGNGERVALDKLEKEGFSVIRVGGSYSEGTVTAAGAHALETGIRIEITEGFNGKLILDSAALSVPAGRPCIELGEHSSLNISLNGSSRLSGGGIKVPPSARLRMTGEGSVSISLGGADYYGIGNDLRSTHGEMIFEQDGTVSIVSDSHEGVCIGSGLGGILRIGRGRYVLKALGSMSVCIGAFNGDADIDLLGCDIEARTAGAHSVVIGSLNGNARTDAKFSSIKCKSGSIRTAAFGTVTGHSSAVHIESVSISVDIGADTATAFGALNGISDIRIERSSLNIEAEGSSVLLFGSPDGNTSMKLTDVDLTAVLATQLDKCYYAEEDAVSISGGRYRVSVNGSSCALEN